MEDRSLIVEQWDWTERSTRNCMHAKVFGDSVHCAKGHFQKLKLSTVLSSATWASKACVDCPDFEHDEAVEMRCKICKKICFSHC